MQHAGPLRSLNCRRSRPENNGDASSGTAGSASLHLRAIATAMKNTNIQYKRRGGQASRACIISLEA